MDTMLKECGFYELISSTCSTSNQNISTAKENTLCTLILLRKNKMALLRVKFKTILRKYHFNISPACRELQIQITIV